MKARAGGKTFEIRDDLVRGGPSTERVLPPKYDANRSVGKLANPVPAPQYDSKWEERYAKKLEMDKATGQIVRFWHHPFSMWLPGKVRYTPDFLVQHHGHLEIVEVKGWSKNLRDGMTRLRIAASIFPCYTWTMAKWNGKDFNCIPVEVDPW